MTPCDPSLSLRELGADAVLLDIDDTLLTTRTAMVAGLTDLAASLWPDAPPERHAAFGQHFRDDPERWFRRFAAGEVTFAENRRGRFDAARRDLDLGDVDYAGFDEGYDAAFVGALAAHEDAFALLDRLDGASVVVGLLTNASEALTQLKLVAVGLGGRYDVLLTRDTLGYGKPDPRVFRLGCDRIGVDPARTAYVGDELDYDAQAAARAGLIGIWVDRYGAGEGAVVPPTDDTPAVRRIASLAELVP